MRGCFMRYRIDINPGNNIAAQCKHNLIKLITFCDGAGYYLLIHDNNDFTFVAEIFDQYLINIFTIIRGKTGGDCLRRQ